MKGRLLEAANVWEEPVNVCFKVVTLPMFQFRIWEQPQIISKREIPNEAFAARAVPFTQPVNVFTVESTVLNFADSGPSEIVNKYPDFVWRHLKMHHANI
jgi:hypothetical protein